MEQVYWNADQQAARPGIFKGLVLCICLYFILHTPKRRRALTPTPALRVNPPSCPPSAGHRYQICWPHDAQMMPAVSGFFLSTVLISEIKKKNQNPILSTLNSQLSILNHAHVVRSRIPQRESSTHCTLLQHSKVHPPHAAGWRTKSGFFFYMRVLTGC